MAQTRSSVEASGLLIGVPGTAEQRASFAAFASALVLDPVPLPSFRFVTSQAPAPLARQSPMPEWGIVFTQPFGYPAGVIPIDSALRDINFNPSVLLPGALRSFRINAFKAGGHYAVPVYAVPWGVQYDTSVFRAVGLADPGPTWGVDDFETCCAAISAAMNAGRIQGLGSVMDPFVYNARSYDHATLYLSGALLHPELVGAFILGFGGTVVSDGRFDLTNAGAVAGLQRLVDIMAKYGPPAKVRAPGRVALRFAQAAAVATTGANQGMAAPAALPDDSHWRWARFPRFPVAPLVPARAGAVTVTPFQRNVVREGTFYPGPPPGTPDVVLKAVGEYAEWWFGRMRRNPALPGEPPPVVVDAHVQDGYWSAPRLAARGYASVGDWEHFAFVGSDWPMVLGGPAAPLTVAIIDAVESRTPIGSMLGQVTKDLNNSLK